ncbi:MAG: helix-turn-helix transcriptional regulator [Oscillospiraceae bacterium]|nr:helix-turn-helix transcriptional regulator [Oscillospiraceae bacterium]
MSMNKELNIQLFERQENEQSHVEYAHEYGYYENIASGNIDEVIKILADPKNTDMYESSEYGKLSKDMLRNMRYHFVVSTSLITRLCVEKGLERELAYTLSDLYISRMDILNRAEDIISLHNDMLMDFTRKMSDLPKNTVYSIHITRAIDFVCRNRTKRIKVDDVSKKLGLNRSYLSSLFIRETGYSLSSFIRREKIKASVNMLRFSDYTYADIAEYFGFASQSHFIQCFKKETGLTPKEFRNKTIYSLSFS